MGTGCQQDHLLLFGALKGLSRCICTKEKLGLSSEPQTWGVISFADTAALLRAVGTMVQGIQTGSACVSALAARQGAPELVAKVPLDEVSGPTPGSSPSERVQVICLPPVLAVAALRSAHGI